jgi:hypothetical protein
MSHDEEDWGFFIELDKEIIVDQSKKRKSESELELELESKSKSKPKQHFFYFYPLVSILFIVTFMVIIL